MLVVAHQLSLELEFLSHDYYLIVEKMAAALPGIHTSSMLKKKGGKDGLKEKIVVLESISFLFAEETLYFIGQKYAMWPPLSNKDSGK